MFPGPGLDPGPAELWPREEKETRWGQDVSDHHNLCPIKYSRPEGFSQIKMLKPKKTSHTTYIH